MQAGEAACTYLSALPRGGGVGRRRPGQLLPIQSAIALVALLAPFACALHACEPRAGWKRADAVAYQNRMVFVNGKRLPLSDQALDLRLVINHDDFKDCK